MAKELTFQSHPDVEIASNTFRNVPTILQFEDTPLLEVGKFEEAGYTIRLSIFQSDGTKIAVVKGSSIYITPEGTQAKITRRHEPDLTVCELDGKPILELRRHGAQALKGWAELYAPEGVLIKANDSTASAILRNGAPLLPGGMLMKGAVFTGCQIGIHVTRTNIVFCTGGGSFHIREMVL